MRPTRTALLLALTALVVLAACSSGGGARRIATSGAAPTTASTTSPITPPIPASGTSDAAPSIPRASGNVVRHVPTTPSTSSRTTAPPTAPSTSKLPLGLRTGDARQVITVVAASPSSTTATLQAWRRSGSGWKTVGPASTAHLGSDGVGQASESSSRTPAGSFTLTQAFGHDSDPGTALPYTHTTPADWWVSEPGSLYNTRQRCSSGCAFTRGDPNEHLYYETPYYNYAVVIDYNTANAPGGVRQGAGSAFFLHVTDGAPTAGCVAIAQERLTTILRWLDPAAHPRILIGVG